MKDEMEALFHARRVVMEAERALGKAIDALREAGEAFEEASDREYSFDPRGSKYDISRQKMES